MKALRKHEISNGHKNMAETVPQRKEKALEKNTAAKEKMAKELAGMGLTRQAIARLLNLRY